MVTLKYAPKRGASHFAPTLKPGETIVVTAVEAKPLIATGVFERIDTPTGEEATPPTPKPRRRPRKEQ